MCLPVFSDIPISLMGAITEFEPGLKLNLPQIFWFLNVRSPNGDFRISDYQPGDIISVKFRSTARGYINKKQILSFPNTISIEMMINNRIIHFKLSKKIQITGCKAYKEFELVLDYLIKHLLDIQDNFARQDVGKLLPNFKPETAKIIMEHLIQLGSPVLGNPVTNRITPIMVNRSFNLGSRINIRKFPNLINQRGFECKHLNFNQEKMSVFYPLETGKRVTFIIHPSGAVTLTGPNCKDIEPVYDIFTEVYSSIQKEVILK